MLSEKNLEWQNPGSLGWEKIRPDLLLRRADGTSVIGDLKLSLLETKSITKAKRARRRFIDPVAEGISQLAHYQEYFSNPENIDYVEEKFGIRIENPESLLIVGNHENVNAVHVEQASRMLKSIKIVDYDTVRQMYLAAKSVPPPSV